MDSFLRKMIRGFVSVGLLLLLWGCSGGTTGSGQLSLQLTDDSTNQFRAVYVTIERVEVHKAASDEEQCCEETEVVTEEDDDEGSWIVVATPKKTFNLLELANGIREELGLVKLTAGHYSQVRLVLGTSPDNSLNILSQQHTFANYVIGSDNEVHELKVPSGLQTGIKIVRSFTINENETTEVVLDFDACRSVVIAGASGQFLLKPTIKILTTVEASLLSGKVTGVDGGTPLSEASVSAQVFNPAAVDPKDRVMVRTSTVTTADGSYALFLSAVSYQVVAYKPGFQPSVAQQTLTAGNEFIQDFSLQTTTSGHLTGKVTINNSDSESFATISFRKNVSLDGTNVSVEVTSLNIVNGGTYGVDLPVGSYDVVSSTSGQATQETTVVVVAAQETTLGITF